jgi:dihydroflavonol-4-reductase
MITQQSKILITGASGLLGSHILDALWADGYRNIVALSRQSRPSKYGETWVVGDILDVPRLEDLMDGIDVVIHAAAVVSFSLRKRDQVIFTSREGTANVVNTAAAYGIQKLIHISSVAAIGRQKITESIDESKIFSHSHFDTSYGLGKFLAEQEVWRAHAEGLNVVILNPATILGIGDWKKSSISIIDKIAHGHISYMPTGATGWVDAHDVARATIVAMCSDIDGQRFIISAENHSFESIYHKIADQLGVKLHTRPLKGFWAWMLPKIESLKSKITGNPPLITSETIHSTSATSVYNHQKSIDGLGLTYRNIDQTIAECCDNYKNSK